MRKILMFPVLLVLAFSLAFISSCSVANKSAKIPTQNTSALSVSEPFEYYTCPVHNDVRSTNPGKCPKCGMNLEKPPFRHALIKAEKTTK
jgi:hypothetical protein